MATMFDKIKKQNGERFAKAIRAYNNGIFDLPDLDKIVRYAGRDAEPIMNYLVSLMDIKIEEHAVHQDPIHLLKMAGYDAFVADTLEKQNSIMEYYAPGEELCTFRDPDRYKKYYIIHAVKKNVKDIKRKDFKNPKREDEYGTSVISIQILKSGGFISIKNRYNHTVQNPDNTFNSNPDNIILGLADALKHAFDVDFSSQKVSVPDGYIMLKGQIIKYNFEIDNTYIGDNFYITNGIDEIRHLDPNSQIMMDCFMLDLKNKRLVNLAGADDAFFEVFNKQLQACKKVEVKKGDGKERCIYLDGVCCARVQDGQITYLSLPNVTEIGDNFLCNNKALTELSLPDVKTIGCSFLLGNVGLEKISLPNVKTIDHSFLYKNGNLTEISLPNVTKIGNGFLHSNGKLSKISLPNLKSVDFNFLANNTSLTEIDLPNVEEIQNSFLYSNTKLSKISLPKVKTIKSDFLHYNKDLTEIDLPNVKRIGGHFLYANKSLRKLSMSSITEIEDNFLLYNEDLIELSLPNVKKIGDKFLHVNQNLVEISLPNVETIGDGFLSNNNTMRNVSLPNVTEIGGDFLSYNDGLGELSLPNVEIIGHNFLFCNNKLSEISLPNVKAIGMGFFRIGNKQQIEEVVENKGYKRPSPTTKFKYGIKNLYSKLYSKYKNLTNQKNEMD